MKPDLTITVVSWNTRDLLRRCLQSVERNAARSSFEVHVVDNASTDDTVAMVRAEFPEVHLIANQQNVGFARANNQSWRRSRGRYWMLLNPDTELQAEALDALVQFMEGHPQAGLATARLIERDGTPQFCAQPVPSVLRVLFEASRLHKCLPAPIRGRVLLGTYWSYDQALRLGWTWGTALIARREAVLQAGCLCEEFFMYGEDVEWCLRMRRHGWEVWFCPKAEVLHLGGQSAAQRWDDAGRRRAVWDAYYQAVRRHRSAGYVWMLQAVTAAALGANCLATRFDRREASTSFSDALAYHLRSLEGSAVVSSGCYSTARSHQGTPLGLRIHRSPRSVRMGHGIRDGDACAG